MIFKKSLIIYAAISMVVLVNSSCRKSFLEVKPWGALSNDQLETPAGIEKLLVAAYASLGGQFIPDHQWAFSVATEPENWLWGSVVGGEAHKGSDNGDITSMMAIARYQWAPTFSEFDDKWTWLYDAIFRCNTVLKVLPKVEGLSDAQIINTNAQSRFLRGLYAFELKKMWNNVPWMDETVTDYKVPNNVDIWPKIVEDFQYAFSNLPETQTQVGRANKWAAGAYLAKAYIFQKKYTEALPLLKNIITNGKTTNGLPYDLQPRFSGNFTFSGKNSAESVFAIQTSLGNGAGGYQANISALLNFPSGGYTGCCGFFQPSIELANSYRTDVNGLPLLDGSYNSASSSVKNDMGIASSDPFTADAGNLDPRIDRTMGRRGIPYFDWGIMAGKDWVRNQVDAGPYIPKKNVYPKNEEGVAGDNAANETWAPTTALNYSLIRFADVLLWAAEAEIEVGTLENARAYINRVRQRAANPADFVQNGGSPAAHYLIGLYNTPWTDQAYARKAVKFERKLELAMEGHRFFDLVRWGDADAVINAYTAYEGAITNDIPGARFTAGKNEYYPIPQVQIDMTGADLLKQNPGYR
ncbi:MAG: RagB/SusD family nutrient uptake outer membrane protein [Chitinophagaceae bacterium]|nr:RagB/SusD family nutrient uptake outer membrane protein [Chitinophagaceae bacterium]